MLFSTGVAAEEAVVEDTEVVAVVEEAAVAEDTTGIVTDDIKNNYCIKL